MGFVGGPWTVLSYGMNMKNEHSIKIDTHDSVIEKLLYDIMFPILRKNIQMQIDEGADLVYVFDTNSIQLEKNIFLELIWKK